MAVTKRMKMIDGNTNEERVANFIKLAKEKNKHPFDYSLVKHIDNSNTYVKVKCKKCNMITTRTAKDHLRGYGCRLCGKYATLTPATWLERVAKVHNNKYDYKDVLFDMSKPISMQQVDVMCPIHGTFNIRTSNHLHGQGCRQCGIESLRTTKEEFLKAAKEKHGDKYDYKLIDFKTSNDKVDIICKEHGVFNQRVRSHMSGQGCPICRLVNLKADPNAIIEQMKEVRPEYDYSKVKYEKYDEKVEVICPKHGSFFVTPGNIIQNKHRCGKCAATAGEKAIMGILDKYNVEYKHEYRVFIGNNKHPYRFDFFISDINAVIEYHGRQHYEHIRYFLTTEKEYSDSLKRDISKKNYCTRNKINYHSIKYSKDVRYTTLKILNKYYSYYYDNKLFKTAKELLTYMHAPLDTPIGSISKYNFKHELTKIT